MAIKYEYRKDLDLAKDLLKQLFYIIFFSFLSVIRCKLSNLIVIIGRFFISLNCNQIADYKWKYYNQYFSKKTPLLRGGGEYQDRPD